MAPLTLPNGLTMNDNDNVIISEVYYSFTPMFLQCGYSIIRYGVSSRNLQTSAKSVDYAADVRRPS